MGRGNAGLWASAVFLALVVLAARGATTHSEDAGVGEAHYELFAQWLNQQGFPPHNLTLATFEGPIPGTTYR
jgi:hypothetical protein